MEDSPRATFLQTTIPTVWMGEHPIVAASKLALQRALIIAMEILDKAFTKRCGAVDGTITSRKPTSTNEA